MSSMKALRVFHLKSALAIALAACVSIPTISSAQTTPAPAPTPTPPPTSDPVGAPPPSASTSPGPDDYRFRDEYERHQLSEYKSEKAKAYDKASEIISCLVRRSKDQAASYFDGALAGDKAYSDLTGALTGKYSLCLNRQSTGVPMYVLNGVLAEKLILRDTPSLSDKSGPVDVLSVQSFYLQDGKIASLGGLARCLVVYSPGLAYKVLDSKAATGAETDALAALYASTPECGVPTPPKVSSFDQREWLATALFAWLNKTKAAG